MEKQADKLYSSLMLLVENIHNPEMLKAILIPLGEKHKGYGAIEQHYPLIGEVLIETLEPLSIFIAVLIFIKELPERKSQFHYQAWSIIDEATGIDNSQARIIALEDLCDDGVLLNGIDLEQAKLQNIEINGVVLTNANLKKTNLTNGEMFYANLSHSDLSESDCTGITLYRSNLGFVNLEKANCSSSNFGKANLMFANLSQGNFSGANFKEANLKGVNFKDAYLSGANFKGANVDLEELKKGYLVDAVMPNGKVFSA